MTGKPVEFEISSARVWLADFGGDGKRMASCKMLFDWIIVGELSS
jgi:hypothetical protein